MPKNSAIPIDTLTQKRTEAARKLYQQYMKSLNASNITDPWFRDSLDYDAVRMKRRIAATIETLDEAQTQVCPICPEIPNGFCFEDAWLDHNLDVMQAFDYIEHRHHTILASAIWMLDQLREYGKFPDACKLFPQDDRVYDEMTFPEIWDPSHENEALLGMTWIIQHRNDDCIGLDVTTPKKTSQEQLHRYYMDQYTTENKHRQQVASRIRFEEILSMIPRKEIDRAVRLFEDTFQDLMRREYICESNIIQRIKRLHKKMDDLEEKKALFVDMVEHEENALQNQLTPLSPLLAVQEPITITTSTNFQLHIDKRRDTLLQLKQLEEYQASIDQERDELEHVICNFWNDVGKISTMSRKTRESTFSPEIAAVWDTFTIPDPYALSFGFLYLLDQGSELPWLYSISVPIMQSCANALPWRYTSFQDDPEGSWHHFDEDYQATLPGYQKAVLPRSIKVPELENWYAMKYEDQNEADTRCRDTTNLAQILYQISGGVMPRNLNRYDTALESLARYGITGKKALHPLLYCMTMLGEVKHRTHVFHLPATPEPEAISPEDNFVSPEELQKKIRELEHENKQLRQAAYDASREARDTRHQIEVTQVAEAVLRQELADLRELVFSQQKDMTQEDSTESTVVFPYTAKKRIVVFGGHDSWAREIKPKLRDVRFIDRDRLPNAELIRRADVIWIQANSLSHAYYYKIIAETRKYNIPVRYFSYDSAHKCAEQLAMYDMQL